MRITDFDGKFVLRSAESNFLIGFLTSKDRKRMRDFERNWLPCLLGGSDFPGSDDPMSAEPHISDHRPVLRWLKPKFRRKTLA